MKFFVQVKKKHYKDSNYVDCVGCPIYKALMEMFPNNNISVGPFSVAIFNKDSYKRTTCDFPEHQSFQNYIKREKPFSFDLEIPDGILI